MAGGWGDVWLRTGRGFRRELQHGDEDRSQYDALQHAVPAVDHGHDVLLPDHVQLQGNTGWPQLDRLKPSG